MQLNKIQDAVIEEFNGILQNINAKRRYLRFIAQLGSLLPVSNKLKKRSAQVINLTKYKVWLDAEYKDGKVFFHGDSNSKIMRGVLAMYFRVLSGRTPKEILDSDLYFDYEIKLFSFFPETRHNDITSILQRLKAFACGFKLKALEESSQVNK
jgi:cysteine desulfuration protein SufE